MEHADDKDACDTHASGRRSITRETGSRPGRARRSTMWGLLRFIMASWRLNLAGAMEFRTSFMMTVGMMILNNTVWLFFWIVYFRRFPVVNGWELSDVMMMWSVVTLSYGTAVTLFGNSIRIASVVANGLLDTYLVQPKPILLHVLVSRMNISAIGDFLFGAVLYGIFGDHSAVGFLKFLTACFLGMLIYLFFNIAAQSLAFFIGNAEGIGHQFFISFLTFSTYPTDIFRGWVRLLLFTALPAGFISYMPIGLLRRIDPIFLLEACGASLVLCVCGAGMFYAELKRYSSGNRIGLRM